MKVDIKISPSPQKLANMFLGAEAKLARRLWEGMSAYAYLIQEKSVKQTPVDQGGLRGSIGTDLEPRKFRAIIKPNVPYDRWIHEGWMRRNGKIVYLLGSMVCLQKLVRIVEIIIAFKTKNEIKNIVMRYIVLLIRNRNELRKRLNGRNPIMKR